MSNFQDNPSVGNPNNKIDGENETPLKWAYEMDKTQFKYRCPCKKGYHVTTHTAMVATGLRFRGGPDTDHPGPGQQVLGDAPLLLLR